MMNGSMNMIKVHSPVSEIGTHSLALNHDMAFAGGIIGKYSMTGQYFFQGTALTFLEMNRNNEEAGNDNNSVYLSLKLLIAYNYQQMNESFTTNQEAYIRNINLMLQNYMNLLKLKDQKGYEYINRVYQLVGTKIEYRERERLQELLEEELKHLTSGSDNQTVLSKEQTDIVKQLALLNVKQTETTLNARDDNSERRSVLAERNRSNPSDMKHHTDLGNIQTPDLQAGIRKQSNNNIQSNTENEDNSNNRNNNRNNYSDNNSDNNSNNINNNQSNTNHQVKIDNQDNDFHQGRISNRNSNNKQENYNQNSNYNQDNTNKQESTYDLNRNNDQDSTHNQDSTDIRDNTHNRKNTDNQDNTNLDNTNLDNNNLDRTFQQESSYNRNSSLESTYSQNNRSNLLYADNQISTGNLINNPNRNDNYNQSIINDQSKTTGQIGIINPDNPGGLESTGNQINSGSQDKNYKADTRINANDRMHVASNPEENTNSASSMEHRITELVQFFQDFNFETSISLENEINLSINEQMLPAYKSEFQYDNEDIPVNIYRKDRKALSQQDQVLFYEIMKHLQILNENQPVLPQGVEPSDSNGYTELLRQFRITFSNRKNAKLFLEDLQQKNINTEDIYRLFSNIKDSNSMILHRDELAKFIADQSSKVQKEVLQTIWKTGKQPDKTIKEKPADWIKAASKEEIQIFITKVEESNSKIFEELLHKKVLEIKPDKGIKPDSVKKLPEKTGNGSPESDINISYEVMTALQNNADRISQRFINVGAFDINQRKEKLIALITERRYGSLSNMSEYSAAEAYTAAQTMGIPEEISYENSAAANELVYIIRNADEDKLGKIERFILSNPLFRSRISMDQIPPAANADISRGLSSIRSYQDSLTGNNSLNSVKNLLVNTVSESTQKAVIRMSELVKSVFGANELNDMLNEIPDKKTSRSSDILSRDTLIYLIRHADGLKFDNLLQTFLAEGAVNKRIIDELVIKEIVKYSSKEETQMLSGTPRLHKDKLDISSISRNRHRQSMKKQENFLKDELVKLIVLGNTSEQEDMIRLMKAEFSEVEQEMAADRSQYQPDNIDQPDNIVLPEIYDQSDIIGLEDRNKKPEDQNEPIYISQGDLTRKLVYYIRKADRRELERIVEQLRLHPSFSQSINQMLNRTGTEQQAISEEMSSRQKPFESSIIRNKLLLEHRRSLYVHSIKQQINELLDHGTVTEQKNLISLMSENLELLQKARNKVDEPFEVNLNHEEGKRYIKQIFEKAEPQELQEFVRIFNRNAAKRSDVEHPENEYQTEAIWDKAGQEELSRKLYQGEVHRLKVSQTEVDQTLINYREVKQSNDNLSSVNQISLKQTDLLSDIANQLKINQDKANRDEVYQEMVNQSKIDFSEILQGGPLQAESSHPELQVEDIILTDRLVFREESENQQANLQQGILQQGSLQQGILQQELLQQQEELRQGKLLQGPLQQGISQQEISKQGISQQDLLQHPENILRQIRHNEILEQNILLQKTILEEVYQRHTDEQTGITNQLQIDGNQIFSLKQNSGRASRAREEEVIKKVKEYIISEQSEINYQNNRNTQTINELKVQKKEISQLKENLQQQNKAVDELKKLIARDKGLPDKMDVNQISRDIMKKLQHEITMARLRKGFD